MENYIFLNKSIGLDPKITMANISASHLYDLGLVELSTLVFAKACETKIIYITNTLLTGHDALLLRQIARDRLYALSHRHDNT